MLDPGWQLNEEVPMLVIIFILVAAVMQFYGVGDLEQKLATALLVSVVAVSLEVILFGGRRV